MTQAREIPTVDLPGNVAMPLVGFGTWQLRGRRAAEAVGIALRAGYRHIDTATMYGNEAEVGRALRDSGLEREELFITTKIPPGASARPSPPACGHSAPTTSTCGWCTGRPAARRGHGCGGSYWPSGTRAWPAPSA